MLGLLEFDDELSLIQSFKWSIGDSSFSNLNALVNRNGELFIAGSANTHSGFDQDAFIHKIDNQGNGCVATESLTDDEKAFDVLYLADWLDNLVEPVTEDESVPKTRIDSPPTPYSSQYSGGFGLLSTFKLPHLCAGESAELPGVDYYLGQEAFIYDL